MTSNHELLTQCQQGTQFPYSISDHSSMCHLGFSEPAITEAPLAERPLLPGSQPKLKNSQPLEGLLNQLQPFLSMAAWQHLYQGHHHSTEPFQATIMFVDLVNSSTLLLHYPLSTVTYLLNHFFTIAEEAIHKYRGFTEKLLGDGLLAVFPDARAALQAAQTIQDGLANFNSWHTLSGDCSLLARATFDSGQIIITNLGGQRRMDHTVVGIPVNAASDLLRLARPGEVWFTQAACSLLREKPSASQAGYRWLKGYSDPQMVYYLPTSADGGT